MDALAKIEQLKVISRTSSFYFKDHKASIKEIAKQLNVSIILEGSVRLRGPMLRITATLINAEDETQFWSQTWDRNMENLFEIQDEISLLIADKLREHVGHLDIENHLVESPTKDLSAYEHYLKGRYHYNKWNPKDTNIAIGEFDKAVAIDPDMIGGQLGLADSYSFLAVAGFAPRAEAWAKAKAAMDIAQHIDPDNAGLNYMLAHQAFFTRADFASAMRFAKKALATLPTHVDSQRLMAFLYILKGEFKKAQDHIFYAKSIDPLNPETLFFEALFFYRTKNYEPASVVLESLLKDNAQNLPALISYAYLKIKLGELDKARAHIEAIPEELLTPDERLGLLALIDVSAGKIDSAHLRKLIQHAAEPNAHHAHSYAFMAFSVMGALDEATTMLDKVTENKSSIMLLSFSDPLSENIKQALHYQRFHQTFYPQERAISPKKKTKAKAPDSAVIQEQLETIKAYVESEQPYLNPALTLRLLADQVAIHPNQLSWLINEHIGKNFNEFINQKRIAHFKKLVVDPSNAHISLLGLAYESGFNSKTVFNTAFKKEVGMTPKAYQKSKV